MAEQNAGVAPAGPVAVDCLTRAQRARREAILEAASGVYCHYGFYGASLSKVAEAAGVSKALVVQYFGSMEELAKLCIERILQDLNGQLALIHRKHHRNYAANAELVLGFFKENRREWRFVTGLLCTPALAGYCRGLVPAFLGGMHEAVRRYERNILPGQTFALTYMMAGHYLAYVLGGHEGNYRRARDGFLPRFLKNPALYEPFRNALEPGEMLDGADEPARGRPAPARSRGEARREEILAAALKVFGLYGYYGATAERIAMTAGVSRSLAFKYCGSVAETAVLCARHFLDGYLQRLRFVAAKYPRFPEQAEELWALARLHRGEWRFIVGMLCTPALDETIRRVCGGFARQLAALLGESCRGLMEEERAAAFAYSLVALYVNYIVGGSEENFKIGESHLYRIYFG